MHQEHVWEKVEGSETDWKCINGCGAKIQVQLGKNPYRLNRSMPYDPCSPQRTKILADFKNAQEIATRLLKNKNTMF
jgi:hypothetical protein